MEFLYTIDPYREVPVMMINGGIGDEINGGQFARELYTLDSWGVKGVKIVINSFGGNVVDGMAIYDAILNTDCAVDTYCSGVALSIAAVIFCAGATRYMADYSCLMFHNPYNPDGTVDEGLEMMRIALVKMIGRTGIDEAQIEEILARETWMEPEEAKTLGFCDEVLNSSDTNKKKLAKLGDAMDRWKGVQTILNKFVKTQDNSNTMAKKTNIVTTIDEKVKGVNLDITAAKRKLSTVKDETKEEIEEEIEELQEELEAADNVSMATTAEAEVTAENYDPADGDSANPTEPMDEEEVPVEAAMPAHETAIRTLKDELAAVKNELDALKTEKAENEAKAMQERVQNMILGYVKAGKIANNVEDIKDWTAQAMTNYDFTVRLIDRLPVTKAAVKIPVSTEQKTQTETYGANFIAMRMRELQEQNKKRAL